MAKDYGTYQALRGGKVVTLKKSRGVHLSPRDLQKVRNYYPLSVLDFLLKK